MALPVVNESQTVNMTCSVFGLPMPSVNWSRFDSNDLNAVAINTSRFAVYVTSSIAEGGGVTVNSTLEVTNVDGADTGNYTCTCENNAHGANLPADVDSETFSVLVQSELYSCLYCSS